MSYTGQPFKYRVDNKMRGAVGETDLEKKTVRINKKKAKRRGKGEVLETMYHEDLHVKHPKMHEKTVYKKEKNYKKLPLKAKSKLYSKYR